MFKFTIVLFAAFACAAAKPGVLAPLAYSSPLIAASPGIVTATSNQVIARNYNGIATAPILAAAPVAKYLAAPVAAPLAFSPAAYTTPLATAPYAVAPAAYAAPLRYAAAAPLAARYAAPFGYASPLSYTAPSQYLF